MAFLSSETFSYRGSFHSGHHKQMPSHLMKVSGPKKHLSLTAVISSQGLTSRSRSEVEGKVFFSPSPLFLLCECHTCDVECQNYNFQPSLKKEKRKVVASTTTLSTSKEPNIGRNLTNVSQSGKSASTNNLMEHYLPRTVCFCT